MFLIFYLIFGFNTIIYLKKKLPNSEEFKKIRNETITFYYVYSICCIILWSILIVMNLLATINCSFVHNSKLNYVVNIGNFAKLMTPIVLPLIRMKDPYMNRIIFKKRNANRKETEMSSDQTS
jgi:hypothetical protein